MSYMPYHTYHVIYTISYWPCHSYHVIHTMAYITFHAYHVIHTMSCIPCHTYRVTQTTSYFNIMTYVPCHAYHAMRTRSCIPGHTYIGPRTGTKSNMKQDTALSDNDKNWSQLYTSSLCRVRPRSLSFRLYFSKTLYFVFIILLGLVSECGGPNYGFPGTNGQCGGPSGASRRRRRTSVVPTFGASVGASVETSVEMAMHMIWKPLCHSPIIKSNNKVH